MKTQFKIEFEMTSLSRAALYLGAKLTYMDEGIFVHQRGYLLKLLKKYGMDNCNSLKVPMSPSVHLWIGAAKSN